MGWLINLGCLGAVGVAVAACSVDASSDGAGGGGSGGAGWTGNVPCLTGDAGTDAGSTVSGGSTTPSKEAMLAKVDPGAKMNASPGEGVGVFVEYETGGHWTLWWTCDTKKTAENCPFDVKLSAKKGGLTNAASMGFTSHDTLITPATPQAGAAGQIEAKTVTTTAVSGITFDADPAADVLLTATVGGLYNGNFLFWVQGGQVKGGYTGEVTDPLLLSSGQ